MPALFRTAYPPRSYRAPILSCASLFRFICILIQYLSPIVICFFYYFHMNQLETDSESPIFTPGDIEQMSLIVRDASVSPSNVYSMSYPADIGVVDGFNPTLEVVKNTNTDGNIESVNYRIKQTNVDKNSEIIGISVIFKFNVKLNKWATSSTDSYGVYTKTFPLGLERFSCQGELVLEQNEPVDFKGSLPNDKIPEMYQISLKNLNEAESNLSSVFRINWYDYVPEYNLKQANSFTFIADLQILVKDINVIHSLPLITIIESIIVIYLSTHILISIVLGYLQHHAFSGGIFRTFKDNHYTSTKNPIINH